MRFGSRFEELASDLRHTFSDTDDNAMRGHDEGLR